MSGAVKAAKLQPILFDVDTGNYRIRTIDIHDASPDWIAWIADPLAARMLNAPRLSLTMDELRTYVGGFNNIDRIIVGFFDQRSGQQIGFATGEYSDCGNYIRPSVLIGEPAHRNIGALQEIVDGFLAHVFDVLPIDGMIGHVLPHNDVIRHLLAAYQWRHVNTLPQAKRKSDGTGFHDVLVYAISREEFAQWRRLQRRAG